MVSAEPVTSPPRALAADASLIPGWSSQWPWTESAAQLADTQAGGAPWPRISIVTPNYNYADLVETTIRSVLGQNYPNLEYIVIDDGSTDASCRVIEKYEPHLAHFEHQANQGQYATINKGVARATGEIVGWINSDDVYFPWTLRVVGSIFSQFPDVQWLTGHPSKMQDGVVHTMEQSVPYPRPMLRAGLFHGGPGGVRWIQQESCFWRRSLWEKVGGLRPDVRYAADYELWTRFADHADLYATTTLLGGFTVRGNQNRSLANRDRYLKEIADVQSAIERKGDPEIARTLRDVRRFQKARKTKGLRGLARKLSRIDRFTGPVLRWDFNESGHVLERRPFFDR